MSDKFEIRREVVLPATPEQVFAAVTTGTAGWMFPTPPIEGPDAPGGAGGPGSLVTAWEPGAKVAVRVDGEDGWFNALEYVIEARDGGTAVLRYVHSGVMADDWDNQYDGASKHTDFYLHSLGQYLQYFAGRPAIYISAEGPQGSSDPAALNVLRGALGITDQASQGDSVRLDVPGLEPQNAVVDYLNEYFIGLRTDAALYRFYGRNAFGGTVDAAHHLFVEGVDPEKTQSAWQAWLNGVYA